MISQMSSTDVRAACVHNPAHCAGVLRRYATMCVYNPIACMVHGKRTGIEAREGMGSWAVMDSTAAGTGNTTAAGIMQRTEQASEWAQRTGTVNDRQ